jgi:hypothetical protein
MLNSPLGGRRGIGFGLGRSWQRKSADWWLAGGIPAANVAGVWQPKGADSLSESYLRIAGDEGYENIDPAIVGGVAPNWDAVNGWIADGTNILYTGIIPVAGMSIIARYSNLVTTGTVYYAITSYYLSGTCQYHMINRANNLIRYGYGNTLLNYTAEVTSGVMAITPTGGYYNGSLVADLSGATFTGTPTGQFPIMQRRRDDLNNYDLPFVGHIQAIAYYSIDISAYVADLTTATNAL